jgi:hypothetical protein
MSDPRPWRSLSFEACEEALLRLDGAVATLMTLWDHATSGDCFSREQLGDALWFINHAIEREILEMKKQLEPSRAANDKAA